MRDGKVKYEVPDIWRHFSWASNFENYPDQQHLVFEEEYDYEFKDEKGQIYNYLNHIQGTARLQKQGKTYPGKPYTYYIFAMTAAYMFNNPDILREIKVKNGYSGSTVVNFANTIRLNTLFPLEYCSEENKEELVELYNKSHIVPSQYGPLYARVYNETSGVWPTEYIKTEPRETKLMRCPNPGCGCIFEMLSKDFYTQDHPRYLELVDKMGGQARYKHKRDTDG